MIDPILFILLVIAFLAVTGTLFGGWLIFTVIRMMGHVVGSFIGLFAPRPVYFPTVQMRRPRHVMYPRPVVDRRGVAVNPAVGRHCARPGCDEINPVTAAFCRRCGSQLPQAQRVSVRRAAMW